MVMRFSHPRFLCYHITLRHEQYLTQASHGNIFEKRAYYSNRFSFCQGIVDTFLNRMLSLWFSRGFLYGFPEAFFMVFQRLSSRFILILSSRFSECFLRDLTRMLSSR